MDEKKETMEGKRKGKVEMERGNGRGGMHQKRERKEERKGKYGRDGTKESRKRKQVDNKF